MNLWALPCLFMASITLYVGLYHLVIFLKRRMAREHLPFSLLCFCVAAYDMFSFGLYNASSLAEGIFWQRFQLSSVGFISVFIIWFVYAFIGLKKSRYILFFALWFSILLIISYFIDPSLTLSVSRSAIKRVSFFNISGITYYEGEVGIFYLLGIISSILIYSYLLVLLFRYFWKTRDRNAIVIIFSQFSYFVGVINDSLVASGVYSFIYISEYTFFIVIFSMSYVLLNEFVSLHKSSEEANINLERTVKERTKEIQKLNQDLKRLSEVDALTGIYNRRFFNNYLDIEIRRAQNQYTHKNKILIPQNDMNFGLSILDVDNFKKINDTYGHLCGDKILIKMVDIIKQNIFSRDIFCRYGGEEFVVIFTRTSKDGILFANKKILKSIAAHPFTLDNEQVSHVTVSIGAVIFEDFPQLKGEEILKIADDRLLLAKKSGKNQIVYSG